MTTPEPMLVVPLSKLVSAGPEVPHEWARWEWRCRICREASDLFPSRAEAESAAVAHLADVHEITVHQPGPPLYLALDLWQAMGLPLSEFDGYIERNGFGETWAVLLGHIRNPLPCGRITYDGTPCVLTPHSDMTPCYSADDVGTSEPLPRTPALRLMRRSIQQHLKERLLTVVEWLEMATTDPTVPSCVIQFDLDRHGLELRAIYEDLEVGFR